MKYKLINKQTNEEHLCDKVTIDGFDYYVSDEKLIPNCYVFDPIRNRITVIYLVSKKGENFGAKKVIATNNPSIDIPKVVDELIPFILTVILVLFIFSITRCIQFQSEWNSQ